jgi:hypothetical protein
VRARLGEEAGGIAGDRADQSADLSAFIFEPLLNVAGMAMPDPRYLAVCVEEVRRRGGLIVVDEIFTGMHRTGPMFGFQRFGIKPEFAIVAAEAVRLDRSSIRLLWQYQWSVARRDRKDACDLLLPTCDSLLLVVRRPKAETVPATLLFTSLKGPADPTLRKPHQLRFRLGQRCTLLNFVHSADEPADLVREVAVCLGADARRHVFHQMLAAEEVTARAHELTRRICSEVPEHTLLLEEVLTRLEETLSCAAEVVGAAEGARAELAAIRAGRSALVDAARLTCPHWDRITIAAHLLSSDYDDWEVLIPGVQSSEWKGRPH